MTKTFIHSESGAVTVDWVVLTAALVGLGIATNNVVSAGMAEMASDVSVELQSDQPRTFQEVVEVTGYDLVENFSLAEWQWTTTMPNDWSRTGSAGMWNPPASRFTDDTGTDAGNVLFLNNGATITNHTGHEFDASKSYTLAFDVGDRTDVGAVNYSASIVVGGVEIGTYEGNTGDSNSLSRFSFEATGGEEALNGEEVTVVLRNTGGTQVNFDRVIMTAH